MSDNKEQFMGEKVVIGNLTYIYTKSNARKVVFGDRTFFVFVHYGVIDKNDPDKKLRFEENGVLVFDYDHKLPLVKKFASASIMDSVGHLSGDQKRVAIVKLLPTDEQKGALFALESAAQNKDWTKFRSFMINNATETVLPEDFYLLAPFDASQLQEIADGKEPTIRPDQDDTDEVNNEVIMGSEETQTATENDIAGINVDGETKSVSTSTDSVEETVEETTEEVKDFSDLEHLNDDIQEFLQVLQDINAKGGITKSSHAMIEAIRTIKKLNSKATWENFKEGK